MGYWTRQSPLKKPVGVLIFRKVATCNFTRYMGFFTGVFQVFFFVIAFSNSVKIKKFLIKTILHCRWIAACVANNMSILKNVKSTFIFRQLLLSTLAFLLYQVSRQDAGKLLINMVLASLLSTWNIAITYMTESIVCVFILSYLKCLGSLSSVALLGNYSFIFRDAG